MLVAHFDRASARLVGLNLIHKLKIFYLFYFEFNLSEI